MTQKVVADDAFFSNLMKAVGLEAKPAEEKTDEADTSTEVKTDETPADTVTKAEFEGLRGDVAKILSLFETAEGKEPGLVVKALTDYRTDIDTLKEVVSSALDRINGVEQAPAVRKSISGQEGGSEPIKKSASQVTDDAFRSIAHGGALVLR